MPKKFGGRSGGHPGERPGISPGEPVGAAELEAESDEAADVYEHIESLKERFGEGEQGRVQVMRRMPDGTLVSLPSLPALTFDVDVVAAKYGGGRYEFKFYKGKQFLGRDSFTIDPAIKPAPEVVVPAAVAVAAPANNSVPSWLPPILEKFGEAVKAFAGREPPKPPDPIEMIKHLSEAARSMMPPAPEARESASLKDQIAMVESIVKVGTTILDARGEGGGGGQSGDVYMAAVSKLADPIVELVKTRAQQEALRAAPRRPALPAPAPAASGPVPVQPSEAPRPESHVTWLAEIQRWLPLIVKRQQKGLSAESTAFFVLDELSEPTLAALAEFLQRDDAEMTLKQVLPAELNNNPAWLSEFLTAVNDYLFAEEDDADQDDVPSAAPPPSGVIDLEAEAAKRLGKLRDKPQGQEQAPE